MSFPQTRLDPQNRLFPSDVFAMFCPRSPAGAGSLPSSLVLMLHPNTVYPTISQYTPTRPWLIPPQAIGM